MGIRGRRRTPSGRCHAWWTTVVLRSLSLERYCSTSRTSTGASTPEDRAKYTKWVVWANTSLEEVCFGPRFSGSELERPGRALDVLNEMLSSSDWLVGNEFSV